MSLIGEIEKLINEELSTIEYRIINIGGKNLYIEGIKNIINLSKNSMEFQLKKRTILIKGSNLIIKYLDNSTVHIFGEINEVATLWNMNSMVIT